MTHRTPVIAFVLAALGSGTAAVAADGAPPVVKTRRALDFLAAAALDWQESFQCSGCHKQPRTVAALATGVRHGHAPPRPDTVGPLVDGTLAGSSGQGADGCLSLRGDKAFSVATAFGGSGLAAYDRAFGLDRRAELVAAADCLLDRQDPDGRLASDHTELPVAQGDFLPTALAVDVWQRTAEVSGDASYTDAAAAAVAWLRSQVGAVEADPDAFTTQDEAMLLLGLAYDGAGPADPDVVRMRDLLAAEQLADGSWRMQVTLGGGNAHATGQVVTALLRSGHDRETDPVLAAGLAWLVAEQRADGSWPDDHWAGNPPSAVAPSMWGAEALASVPSPLNTVTVNGAPTSTVSWDPVTAATGYDLVRARLSELRQLADRTDLGDATCLAADVPAAPVTDGELPPAGGGFVYLMRVRWSDGVDVYGRSSAGLDREPTTGDCPE